jgi:class 3 adenylate cyclase
MRCSGCQSENPSGMSFCGKCGARLVNRCPNCDFESPSAFNFCGQRGSALSQAKKTSASVPQQRAATPTAATLFLNESSEIPEGERKTVTALFADIKGSTELMEDLDPEEARAIVDPALKLMIDAVHRYDGYIVQSTGDGIFALFGAPVAHEDHPQRALYAALRIEGKKESFGSGGCLDECT